MQFTDRSRTELSWTCPRARYWQYEWHGIGLAPLIPDKDLDFGGKMADQILAIKQGKAWTVSAFAGLHANLAAGLLTGYELIVWPRWIRDYDVVSLEEEQPLQLTEWLTYNTRPDTVTRRKADGSLWYGPEDKTTSYLDSLLSYAGNVQLHATAIAIEHHKGERVAGAMIQGLYKGFEKEGRLYHPLVNAYLKEGRAGIIPDQWSSKWVRGWDFTQVTHYPGGLKAWVEKLYAEEGALAGVFPNSEPVTIKRPFVKDYLAQLVTRESVIAAWKADGSPEDQLDRVFPQHFSQCDGFSKSRKPCVWKEACFNPTAKRFPLTFYKMRVPHHANEKEALGDVSV